MNLDLFIFNYIHQFAGKYWPLDWLGIFLAVFLAYFLYVAILYFGFYLQTKKEKTFYFAVMALSALFSRGVFTETIRFFYQRLRPYDALGLEPLISPNISGSFPSGHAAFFFAISFTLLYFNKKWGIWFLVFSVLMGLARVFVGVHYPADILGGAVLGLISAWLTMKLMNYKEHVGTVENE